MLLKHLRKRQPIKNAVGVAFEARASPSSGVSAESDALASMKSWAIALPSPSSYSYFVGHVSSPFFSPPGLSPFFFPVRFFLFLLHSIVPFSSKETYTLGQTMAFYRSAWRCLKIIRF